MGAQNEGLGTEGHSTKGKGAEGVTSTRGKGQMGHTTKGKGKRGAQNKGTAGAQLTPITKYCTHHQRDQRALTSTANNNDWRQQLQRATTT